MSMASMPRAARLTVSPGLKGGSPLYGHDAHRKASPSEQFPHEDFAAPAVLTMPPFAAASAASSSLSPHEQFLHARRTPSAPVPQSSVIMGALAPSRSSLSSTSWSSVLPPSAEPSFQADEAAADGAAANDRALRLILDETPTSQFGLRASRADPVATAEEGTSPARVTNLRSSGRVAASATTRAPPGRRTRTTLTSAS
eukprot:Amastigsp_a510926_141.p2 type:complete len:199 gc:universal Amastigsp_a510926_141:35-631(+)